VARKLSPQLLHVLLVLLNLPLPLHDPLLSPLQCLVSVQKFIVWRTLLFTLDYLGCNLVFLPFLWPSCFCSPALRPSGSLGSGLPAGSHWTQPSHSGTSQNLDPPAHTLAPSRWHCSSSEAPRHCQRRRTSGYRESSKACWPRTWSSL